MYRKLVFLISSISLLCIGVHIVKADIKSDLISYWKLDDGSGTIAKDSTGSNNGTLKGDAKWAEGWVIGAIELDGADDYIDCGEGTVFNTVCRNVITLSAWVKPNPAQGPDWGGIIIRGWGYLFGDVDPYDTFALYYHRPNNRMGFKTNGTSPNWLASPDNSAADLFNEEWHHVAAVYDGAEKVIYLDGVEIARGDSTGQIGTGEGTGRVLLGGGRDAEPMVIEFGGRIDEARIYDRALTHEEIIAVMENMEEMPYAMSPVPPIGALVSGTWVTLYWRPGDFAVSHDLYMGDNFEDVNEAARDSALFRGSLTDTFAIAGFQGTPYPDQLMPGTTYYWRIDEVNEAEPNSPWKGKVWSFSIPSKSAYEPFPADGAEFVDLNVQLTWTAGLGAKLHYIVFGDDFDVVSSADVGTRIGPAKYSPGPLKLAKTYYWRIDESDGFETYKGQVWSFTTEGAVSGPNPDDGAIDIDPAQILTWDAGAVAESHNVYFGTYADAVKNATTASPEYKGSKALGDESFDPGMLMLNTTYCWRVDEVNEVNLDSPWAGNVWSFTTGDFFVIDDFEDYDVGNNEIWWSWKDGLGYVAHHNDPAYPGNDTGSAVGDETTASYTEETIIHWGNQSMPFIYDNNKQGYLFYSETEKKLTDIRDWTKEDITELSLWFRGYPASVGSFVEGPLGTYTITSSGADIWNVNGVEADEFHFAYKMLTGAGSIIAKVNSVDNTNGWAKAGVMIRESLNPDSAHAFACVTPSNGVASQGRPSTGGASFNTNQTGITAPYWVKLERSISGLFTVSHSANGSTWQQVTGAVAQNISMGSNVYIGLAVTAHDAAATCQAVFSNITTTGNVTGQWAHQDIGIASNDAELLYVALSNRTGTPAVVVHDDPAAAQVDTWTEWIIPLSAFADQGINLTDVDRLAVGLGTKGNMTIPGGSGKIFFDDIRIYRPQPEPEPQP
jgi:hypothetical protein